MIYGMILNCSWKKGVFDWVFYYMGDRWYVEFEFNRVIII